MVTQLGVQACQRCPYYLFQRLPLFVHLEHAGLQTRHIQQVVDRLVQALCFLVDGLAQFTVRWRVERCTLLQQAAGGTGNRRQGRAQIV